MKYVWVMDVSQQARKRVYSLLERLTAACYRNNRLYSKTVQAKLLVIEMNFYQTSEKCNLNSEFVTGSGQSIVPK